MTFRNFYILGINLNPPFLQKWGWAVKNGGDQELASIWLISNCDSSMIPVSRVWRIRRFSTCSASFRQFSTFSAFFDITNRNKPNLAQEWKSYKWHKVQTIRTMHSLIPCTVTSQCGTPLKEWKSLAIRTSKTFHIPMYHTIKGMEINSSPHFKNISHPNVPHHTAYRKPLVRAAFIF